MDKDIKLLPCPFCGGEAKKRLIEEDIMHIKYYGVMCTKCYSKTTGYQDYVKAVDIWNKRK